MLRVFTAFSGYDSQCLALREVANAYDCGFRWELVGWSEIDKYAIKAHNALFPQWADRNYGDISKIDWEIVPDFDLFTYSSPCQDFSQAGKQKGAEKGSGTRSSLLWECERAIRIKRPKYLLFENVAAVASKKFVKLFNSWQITLEQMGYTNFTQILNAKTHGYPTPVPQNRKRIFMVSILNCEEPFIFPEPQPLTTCLDDILEDNVHERYFLSPERTKEILESITISRKQKPQSARIYTTNGISPTICATEGVKTRTKIVLGWTRDHEKGMVINRHPVEVANAITATKRENTQNFVLEPNIKIRKLTERECFRLMGVNDRAIDIIQTVGISRSQQFKLSGNSIVVNTLAAIFRQLFISNFNEIN